jgi:Hint domain
MMKVQTDHPGAIAGDQRQGMLPGTLVRSLDGVLPVEFLCPGDRIVCRQGARRLVSIRVSHHDRLDLIRFSASSLGHGCPERDLWLGPDQPVLIRDWRALVLYNQPMAAIPAARLVDGAVIRRETLRDIHLLALQFDDDAVIYAEGIELSCPAMTPAFSD